MQLVVQKLYFIPSPSLSKTINGLLTVRMVALGKLEGRLERQQDFAASSQTNAT